LIIRRATPADVEAIARAHVRAWHESYRDLLPRAAIDARSVETRVEQWRGILENPDILVYLAERDRELCGFGSGGEARTGLPAEAEVYSFYLLEAAKRRGLGRMLFMRLGNELAARGSRSLGLWVLVGNASARRFYEAMGGRSGETRLDRRGEFVFDDIAYIWDDLAAFALV
jgi:ribosomal protein S18 acetylase RimI-like enzyme